MEQQPERTQWGQASVPAHEMSVFLTPYFLKQQ
jgi:hypothetical protein